jgi:hypothetical protein
MSEMRHCALLGERAKGQLSKEGMMGEDLILEMFSLRNDGRWKKITLVKRRQAALKAVSKVTPAQWRVMAEDYAYDFDLEGEEVYDAKDMKKEAEKIIRDVFECIYPVCWRTVTTWHRGRELIYCAGGMTWGDDPSEAYTRFAKLRYLPKQVHKEMGVIW